MKNFEVWLEGYSITGNSSTAQFLGSYYEETFQKAVEKALTIKKWDMSYYNSQSLTYWGCRFFDNEQQARKNFG